LTTLSPARLTCQLPELLEDFSRYIAIPEDREPIDASLTNPRLVEDRPNEHIQKLRSHYNPEPKTEWGIDDFMGCNSTFDLEWNIYYGFPKGDTNWIKILDPERLSFMPLDWY
jgi:hypothetical protein